MAKIEVKVPDIGDFKNIPIIEILVKPGDKVKADQSLITLESDKATMDVPSPSAGVVGEIIAKIGDKVSMGSLVLMLDEQGAAAPASAPTPAPSTVAAPAPAAAAPSSAVTWPAPKESQPVMKDFSGVNAGPAVRRLARELGVDLTTIKGSGEKGRITRDDLKASLAGSGGGSSGGGALPEVPLVDFAKFGPVETVPLSRIKRISGPRLHASWVNVPHVTHADEADVTELEAFRKSLDDAAKLDKKAPYRVSLLPLLMKASVATLKAFPTFNSALAPAKDALIYRQYWNIGVAVDTPDGYAGRDLYDLVSGRHRRNAFHAHRQCARSCDPRRRALEDGASLGRAGLPAAPHAAALPFLRSPRDRWRRRGALHAPSGDDHRGHAAGSALSRRSGALRPLAGLGEPRFEDKIYPRSSFAWPPRSGFPTSAISRMCRSLKSW